jgi:hypothetical protein
MLYNVKILNVVCSIIAGATHLPTALQMVHNAIDYEALEKHAVRNI